MPEPTFADLFDWLADRVGTRVLVEAGINEGATSHPQLIFPLSIHATLGEVEHEEGVGSGLTVHLRDVDDRDRLWIDPQRVSQVEFVTPAVVRVWLAGSCFIQLASARIRQGSQTRS
jgi:hypothetical protein